MDPEDIEKLRAASRIYDIAADIVANFQFWCEIQKDMAPTVKHFERFPTVPHPDTGNPMTPDFTVLYEDGSALIGEIARQAKHPGSFESLWTQIEPYSRVTEVPSDNAGGTTPVEMVDALVITPHHVSNELCRNIRGKQEQLPTDLPIRVFEFSSDATDGVYTFKCPPTEGNVPPRGNDREPSFESWLEGLPDGLRGLPKNFTRVKVPNRFMNDEIPPLYLATVLWSEVFAHMASGPEDIEIEPSKLADYMRGNFGNLRTNDIRKAMDLLDTARLAEKAGSKWNVGYHELGKGGQELEDALVARLKSAPKGPITHSEKRFIAEGQAAQKKNKAKQARLELEE